MKHNQNTHERSARFLLDLFSAWENAASDNGTPEDVEAAAQLLMNEHGCQRSAPLITSFVSFAAGLNKGFDLTIGSMKEQRTIDRAGITDALEDFSCKLEQLKHFADHVNNYVWNVTCGEDQRPTEAVNTELRSLTEAILEIVAARDKEIAAIIGRWCYFQGA